MADGKVDTGKVGEQVLNDAKNADAAKAAGGANAADAANTAGDAGSADAAKTADAANAADAANTAGTGDKGGDLQVALHQAREKNRKLQERLAELSQTREPEGTGDAVEMPTFDLSDEAMDALLEGDAAKFREEYAAALKAATEYGQKQAQRAAQVATGKLRGETVADQLIESVAIFNDSDAGLAKLAQDAFLGRLSTLPDGSGYGAVKALALEVAKEFESFKVARSSSPDAEAANRAAGPVRGSGDTTAAHLTNAKPQDSVQAAKAESRRLIAQKAAARKT